MVSGALTMISEMELSLTIGSMGPRPSTSSATAETSSSLVTPTMPGISWAMSVRAERLDGLARLGGVEPVQLAGVQLFDEALVELVLELGEGFAGLKQAGGAGGPAEAALGAVARLSFVVAIGTESSSRPTPSDLALQLRRISAPGTSPGSPFFSATVPLRAAARSVMLRDTLA